MVKSCIIVGFGSHARNSWYHAIKGHPDWKLIGIVDTDTELLDNVSTLAPELDDDMAYISIEDAIRYGNKPDLVIIATPIYTHHVLVKDAIDNDINVICEKNMASNINQGRQIVQMALDHPKLSTAMGHQYRFFTRNWIAHKYLNSEDNEIGKLSFIRAHECFNFGEYRRGWRRWLQDLNLEDQAIHFFDLIRYISGMDIIQVKADVFIRNFSDWQGSSTTLANLALATPENYKHRRQWVWCEYYSDWQRRGPPEFLWEFSGDRGRFIIDENWGLKLWLYKDEQGFKWEEECYLAVDAGPVRETPYVGQQVILEQMSKSIDSGGKIQPDTNFIDAFKSFAVTMAAIESSRTGKAVFVPKYWEDMNIE
ncbi:MAG: Gfo/Idh/MocA family protein [Promethearchaeota archaeon]